ncbi:MAG: hypothetical protein LBU74_05850 [Methanobacteriaceae archaeon]|jgi:hypothetical protein|nr:hypothetical protein [Candidatus Methanorudis spinitermitis]
MNLALLKDSKGILFSTEFLLTIILFVLIIGIVASLMVKTDEKILNSIKTNNLESYSSKVADSLISSPGSPENWEKLSNFNNVIAGLSIQNGNKEVLLNTISFKKINTLKSNYNTLISKNIFNNEIKSSISIYPLNKEINPIIMGDEINNDENFNVFVVSRMVKCDFLSELAILSLNNENKNENYLNNLCNHNTLNNLSHENIEEYNWICKEFKISKKDLQYNDYYLIFDEESTKISGFWILDNIKRISNDENNMNNVKTDLNSYFEENLENNSELIFYLHCKIPTNNKNKFNCVLVAIPKEMEIDDLNFSYFTFQTCQFILKTTYN